MHLYGAQTGGWGCGEPESVLKKNFNLGGHNDHFKLCTHSGFENIPAIKMIYKCFSILFHFIMTSEWLPRRD